MTPTSHREINTRLTPALRRLAMIVVVATAGCATSEGAVRHRMANPASTQLHTFMKALFGVANDTTSKIPGFNDIQRGRGRGANDYGPEARLYVAPNLKTLTITDF